MNFFRHSGSSVSPSHARSPFLTTASTLVTTATLVTTKTTLNVETTLASESIDEPQKQQELHEPEVVLQEV